MSKLDAFLYKYRGYILGLFAVCVLLYPPFPLFEQDSGTFSMYLQEVLSFGVLGVFLRVKARQHIGEHSRGSKHEADELVTSGVYAYIRHPLYISNIMIIWGMLILHLGFSPLMLFFVFVGGYFEMKLANIEDRFLESRFGDVWRTWASRTGYFPSLSSFWGEKGKKIRALSKRIPPKRTFMQAFYADRSTWAWLLFCNLLLILRKVF